MDRFRPNEWFKIDVSAMIDKWFTREVGLHKKVRTMTQWSNRKSNFTQVMFTSV